MMHSQQGALHDQHGKHLASEMMGIVKELS